MSNQMHGIITHLRAPTREHNEGRALARCPDLISRQNPNGVVAFYSHAWRSDRIASVGMRVTLGRVAETTKPGDPHRRWIALDAIPTLVPGVTRAASKPNSKRGASWITKALSLFGINRRASATS